MGGGVKVDKLSLNMGSTKSRDSKKSNRRILPKDCNIPLSAMKYATQNEFKSFAIGAHVTLFVLNNLELNEKDGLLNPCKNHQAGSISPSAHPPPCNIPDNLTRKYITFMLYKIILLAFLLFFISMWKFWF